MLVLIALLCLAVALLYTFLSWKFDHFVKKGIPGPKPTILLGNIPSAITRKRNMIYDIEDIYKEFKGKQRLVGIFNIRNPQIMALDPEFVKDILIKNFRSFHDNEFADFIDKETDPIFGNNPFMLKGNEWKEKRSEITPAFTASRMKAMYPLILNVCGDMTQYLDKEIKKESPDGIDTRELAAKYTTDVVSSCIFALDAESFKNDNAKIRQMGKELMTPSLRIIVFFLLVELSPILGKLYKQPFVPKHIEKFFTDIMHDAIQHRLASKIDRADYLHYLLALREKKNLSDLQVVAHAVTFFVDGFETSSIAMAFTLYELAKDKRVQDKVRAEIKEFEAKGDLTFEVINEMPYLDQVFHENLRLNSPAGFISKRCTEDIKTNLHENDPSSEIQICVGETVLIPIHSIHRDAENYIKPDAFWPERFDPENGGLKSFKDKGVFLPFGDGPRICLGQKFAILQVKAGIVDVVKNYEMTVNSKTQEPLIMDPANFIILPIGGFWLNYKKL